MSTPVHAAIAARCPAPEWATFFEVSNDAGFGKTRSADAVAMNLWPSRGLAVHGFEVKVSRSDMLRELKDPAKSASIQRFCDYWWVAVSDDKVAKAEEMPDTWGLMVLHGKKLVIAKQAPKLPAEPLTRGFIAAVMRRASENQVPKVAMQEEINRLVHDRVRQTRDSLAYELEASKKELLDLRQALQAFEQASGIKVHDRWTRLATPMQMGAAVAALLRGDAYGHLEGLVRASEVAATFVAHANEAVAAIKAIGEKATQTPTEGDQP